MDYHIGFQEIVVLKKCRCRRPLSLSFSAVIVGVVGGNLGHTMTIRKITSTG